MKKIDPKKAEDALKIMEYLDSAEWSLTRIPYDEYLTDEWNEANKWQVGRHAAPYCDLNGERRWNGPTAIEAFEKAIKAINEMKRNWNEN